MNDDTIKAIHTHVAQEFGDGKSPKEACGVVIEVNGVEKYVPCRNIAGDPHQNFRIDPDDYADAEDEGEVKCIVHSHPFSPSIPSEADKSMCEECGIPWLIVSWPSGSSTYFSPSGFVAPLLGRKFVHGVHDCYALVRDYFKQELNIVLPDFERDDEWWNKNQNLYLENFEKAGFFEVEMEEARKHDCFLMQMRSPVPNHAAVYLGDNVIMHHMMNSLSRRDALGFSLRRHIVKTLRHEEFKDA